MTACDAVVTSRLEPSGGVFATYAVPTRPPAPVRFSTITDWASAVESSGAIMRAIWSGGPPAEEGTMMRMILPDVGCVCADKPAQVSSSAVVRGPRSRRDRFIDNSSCWNGNGGAGASGFEDRFQHGDIVHLVTARHRQRPAGLDRAREVLELGALGAGLIEGHHRRLVLHGDVGAV